MAYCTVFIVCTSLRPISNLSTLSIIYLGSLRVRLTLCIVFACPCYFVCLFIFIHIHISPSQHRSLATTGCFRFKDSSRSLSNVPGQHTVLLYTHTHCFAVSTLSHLLSHYIRTHTSPFAPPLPIRPIHMALISVCVPCNLRRDFRIPCSRLTLL